MILFLSKNLYSRKIILSTIIDYNIFGNKFILTIVYLMTTLNCLLYSKNDNIDNNKKI